MVGKGSKDIKYLKHHGGIEAEHVGDIQQVRQHLWKKKQSTFEIAKPLVHFRFEGRINFLSIHGFIEIDQQ